MINMLECIENYNDAQIKSKLGGKKIKIKYKDSVPPKSGVVINFIKAAIYDDNNRTIMGVILDDGSEIVLSKEISSIEIIN